MQILNQTEIMKYTNAWIFYIFIIVISILLCVLLAWSCGEIDIFVVIFFMGCVVVMLIMVIMFCNKIPSGRYRYEVLLTGEMPFTEMYEKYEVMENRGSIWVLEDKEDSLWTVKTATDMERMNAPTTL